MRRILGTGATHFYSGAYVLVAPGVEQFNVVLWVCFLWLPIIPLKAYRIKQEIQNSHRQHHLRFDCVNQKFEVVRPVILKWSDILGARIGSVAFLLLISFLIKSLSQNTNLEFLFAILVIFFFLQPFFLLADCTAKRTSRDEVLKFREKERSLEEERKTREEEERRRQEEEARKREELKRLWEEERKTQEELRRLREMEERRRQEEEARSREEETKRREREERKRKEAIENIIQNYKDVIDRFLEIAERSVSRVDEYGDENWETLETNIKECMKKLGNRASGDESWGIAFHLLPNKLRQLFIEYHSERKERRSFHEDLNKLSGEEFEQFVENLLKDQGYVTRRTPRTGDQGADIIATRNGRKIVIQTKRQQGTVGNRAIQEVLGALHYHESDEAWVVTNSRFTPSARDLAQKSSVMLIDGDALQRMRTRK